MSKVKIKGDASGTGVFTVTAPATNTDRTITLPDSTGTVLTTAGGTITGDLGVGTTPDAKLTVGGTSSDRLAHFVNTQNADGSIAYITVRPTSGSGALLGQTGHSTTTSQYTWLGNAGDDVAGGGGMGLWIYRGTADLKHRALPAFFARAWGTTTISPSLLSSGNVSSVSDIGASSPTQYLRINLTTAMPDANYAVVTGHGGFNRNYNGYEAIGDSDNWASHKTSSYFDIDIQGVGGLDGSINFYFAIFR